MLRDIRQRDPVRQMVVHVPDGVVDRFDPVHPVSLLSQLIIRLFMGIILFRIALFCPLSPKQPVYCFVVCIKDFRLRNDSSCRPARTSP